MEASVGRFNWDREDQMDTRTDGFLPEGRLQLRELGGGASERVDQSADVLVGVSPQEWQSRNYHPGQVRWKEGGLL